MLAQDTANHIFIDRDAESRRPRFDENNMRYLRFLSRLWKRKYRMLFSSKRGRRPGPKGPEKELIGAVVEMKRRNPNWGSPRIAQQIASG